MDKQDVAGLSTASMTFVVIQLSSGPIDMNATQLVFYFLLKGMRYLNLCSVGFKRMLNLNDKNLKI